MIVEKRATLKRITTMLCSIAVLACFGYAAGGAGGYLAGRGRPFAVASGLAGGAAFTCLSFRVWKSYLRDVEIIEGQERGDGEPRP